MTRFVCSPGSRLQGDLRVPGDKSISHRSVMLAAIAEGSSRVRGFLLGEDSLDTMRAFEQMGIEIDRDGDRLTIQGRGKCGLRPAAEDIYLGNSGTAMRLLLGLLAGQNFDSRLTGDASLSGRPMGRVIEPLRSMGAQIDSAPGDRAPLRVRGRGELRAIDYPMPIASAQVKSCLLLAGLYARGEMRIHEPAPSRDHSERMLRAFGCEIRTADGRLEMAGQQNLTATDIDVPADISSAAFFMVAASIAAGSDIILRDVGVNPTRTGVIEILRRMGADIALSNRRDFGAEPVADIRVRSAALRGIDIPPELVPLAIDEFPVLFVAAACAEGVTRLGGAAELRVKESDRIQAMADGLAALGVAAQPQPDGIVIEGGEFGGGRVDSRGDHRIAMAFAVASSRASSDIEVRDCANVDTSFPGFVELARGAGLGIEIDGD